MPRTQRPRRPAAVPLLSDAGPIRYKVLVVEDSEDERVVLRERLQREGFTVLESGSAEEGLVAAVDSRPDIVLSDVALPAGDGFSLCRNLRGDRRTAHLPIILISGSKTRVEEQIEGMELGADDYLIKPYEPRMLLARLRTVLRRYAAPSELRETLAAAGLTLDIQARTVSHRGRRVDLTRKEFDLLTTLLRKRGRVLSVPYLLETVWGYDPAEYNSPQTVQAHVSTLRKKLGAPWHKAIVSVPGLGYRLDL